MTAPDHRTAGTGSPHTGSPHTDRPHTDRPAPGTPATTTPPAYEIPPMTPRRWLESLGARAAFGFARLIGLERASATGAWLARTIGPRIKVSRIARRNIARAFPDLDPPAVEAILRGMWDNLGRTAFEVVHLDRFDCTGADPSRVEVIGGEHVFTARDDDRPGIFVSGHFGNWELASLAATQQGIELTQVYRAANDTAVEQLIQASRRRAGGATDFLPKGARTAREIIKRLKAGGHLAMLIDQKLNTGTALPFFGRDAMSTTAHAEFAVRFNAPMITARVERLHGPRFRVIIDPPIDPAPLPHETPDQAADRLARLVNTRLENWIRARPDLWFWVHKRWPD
ncbi:lysophospholipid acyltransferase family protein [Tistrella arctica]|uniref:Lauroyl acyltransferase n=2 Tax=Tistrella TaxID=171436 RepID=A0ABU9YJE4_9PROT